MSLRHPYSLRGGGLDGQQVVGGRDRRRRDHEITLGDGRRVSFPSRGCRLSTSRAASLRPTALLQLAGRRRRLLRGGVRRRRLGRDVFALVAVPHARHPVRPLEAGAGDVDPGEAVVALDHGAAGVRAVAVARDRVLVVGDGGGDGSGVVVIVGPSEAEALVAAAGRPKRGAAVTTPARILERSS